jgi:hypothetical protein
MGTMTLPIPDRKVTLDAVRDVTSRWANLLRSVTDPSRTAIGHWSISEVATHTSHIFGLYPELVRGGTSYVTDHLNMSEEWERQLRNDPERDLDAIAKRIEQSTDDFLTAVEGEDWAAPKHWHGGLEVPVYTLASVLISESALHGLDVARAETRPWTVESLHASLTIDGFLPFLHHFVNPDAVRGLDAVFELKIRGGSHVYVTIHDSKLSIDEARPVSIDCKISADPVSYVLVGFGRISQLRPILMGKIIAYGKKPWLGLRFGKLFRQV